LKTVALLAALLGGLLFIERSAEPATADAEEAHRPLVDLVDQESLEPTGIVLSIDGNRHEYRLDAGTWRCMTAYGAVAHPRQIADLIRALLTRTAAWRAPSTSEGTGTGFGLDAPIRVELFRNEAAGASLVFLLGDFVRSPNGSSVFVRREGVDGVWELNAEHLEPLSGRESAGLPPLLDRRLTAGCILDPSRGIGRAFIDFEGGASLELRPEEDGGVLRWVLSDGTTPSAILPFRFAGWLSFLQRAPYAGFTNPRGAAQRGLEPPAARVTLFPPDAPPIELLLGREVNGEVYLQNRTSGMLLLLPPDSSHLVAPDARAMTVSDGANPWEPWLR